MKKIPYAAQDISKEDILGVANALRSDFLTQGPRIALFEQAVADFCGSRFAVAVNSGTAALHIACLAAEIKPGDEVITSAITFVASANAPLYCGARPVFADVVPETVLIDVEDINKKINKHTKAIIPVDFAGQPADMKEIMELAKKRGITVIEDAAHSLGAQYRGAPAGSGKYADMTTLSFHAVKHITTGEGGMVLTNDKKLYEKLLLLRTHGITRSVKKSPGAWYYEMQTLGYNYRITDFQCALGLEQLKRIEKFILRRRSIVEQYNTAFARYDSVKPLLQKEYAVSSNHLYVLRFNRKSFSASRAKIFDEYRQQGIMVNVHYIPVYYHPYYKKMGYKKGLCPNAEKYYEEAVTLPLYPKMTETQVQKVISVTEKIIKKYSLNA